MKVIKFEFEGSPEEFRAVAHLFHRCHQKVEAPRAEEPASQGSSEPREVIRKMVFRPPNPDGPMAIYEALTPGRFDYDTFLAEVGMIPRKLDGKNGGQSNECNETKETAPAGLADSAKSILIWEMDRDTGDYRLTPISLEALKG